MLVLDCMAYHCGGTNRTALDRRAVNHVYTIAMFRQQIDLPPPWAKTSAPTLPSVLLGFRYPTARSVAEFIAARERKS